MPESQLQRRAAQYARKSKLKITHRLGEGTDGTVWRTDRNSAIKLFQSQKNYCMELGCYQRLTAHNVRKIGQFHVPRLLNWDDSLIAIEISIVTPPYLIDFGKAYLDHEPEHSREAWQYYIAEQRELWEDRFNEVQGLLYGLRRIGIYYRDPKPGNIMFRDDS